MRRERALLVREEVLDSDLKNFIGSVYVTIENIVVVKLREISPKDAMQFIENGGTWAYELVDYLKYDCGMKRTVILMQNEEFHRLYEVL